MGKRARKQSQAKVKARAAEQRQMAASVMVDDDGFVLVSPPSAQEMHEAEVMAASDGDPPSRFGLGRMFS